MEAKLKMVGRTQDPYLSKRIQQPTSILFKMYQEKKKTWLDDQVVHGTGLSKKTQDPSTYVQV